MGARDLVEERDDDGLSRLFAAVEVVITVPTGSRRRKQRTALLPGAA